MSPLTRENDPNALDSDVCAQEPIEVIGHTQSYGFLLAVSEPGLIVGHASANVFDLLDVTVGDVVGQSLAAVIGKRQFRDLRARLAQEDLVSINPLQFGIGRPWEQFHCVAHRNNGDLILEFEPLTAARTLRSLNFEEQIQAPITAMEEQTDIEALAHVAAREVQRLSGFDRVMVYRFEPNWNGHVIAEIGDGWQSYLGHRFPASDIPAQARRLFLMNTLRSIVDVGSSPVPILSDERAGESRALDLSHSVLRSASLVHIQYLRNMDVSATMTLSVIVRGVLWGLVTAHHSSPYRLDFLSRSVCKLIGRVLAAQIVALEDNVLLRKRLDSRERIKLHMAARDGSVAPGKRNSLQIEPLLGLLSADGVISVIDGVIERSGVTVAPETLRPVITELRAQSTHGVASSNRLAALDKSAADYAGAASGALYIGLSDADDDYLLLLRRELVQTLVWAGNPHKSTIDEATQSLSPRASFASWKETARGSSLPWTDLELENAYLLREQFINERLLYHLQEQEILYQQARARSTLLQQAILPPLLPDVPGLAFDAFYESGRTNEQIGGDWYDAFRLLDGRVLVTIGDVAGSGVGAAVIMGVVRQIMRGISQLHPEPALLLDAADRALRLEYPNVFVTAWVGVFDLVARTLAYASAGHPPPLLLESSRRLRELDHRTLPIGLRQGHQGHASTVSLAHEMVLCLYTDGLIEATHNILEGIGLLRSTVASLGTDVIIHPAAVIRHLVIPEGSSDDVAILVVNIDFDESERHLSRSRFDASDGEAARRARREFKDSLSPELFSENDIANAELVFGELCGNAARYAPGIVDVVVDRSGPQIVLHILDRGAGFRHLSRLPTDVLSESGRGLFIIAAMTSEFTVTQRVDGGSHARAVLVGRYPQSLLRDEALPAASDQVSAIF
jgi:light-regulated signal transduction histidine kinase (bacteriophytochrome)/anti-sigma regulatory factor (Ser/Thr protein kinase)